MEQQQKLLPNQIKEVNVFDMLTTNTYFPQTCFSREDFNVDLVMKMKLPKSEAKNNSHDVKYQQIFKGLPQIYRKVYHEVEEYISFEKELKNQHKISEKREEYSFKSFEELEESMAKRKRIINSQEYEEGCMEVICDHGYTLELSMFIAKYNMIMITLQAFCGFKVKTFLLQTQTKTSETDLHIYFLLTMTEENLFKAADRYKINKDIDLALMDMSLNEPKDKKQREIWVNTNFLSYVSQFNETSLTFMVWREQMLKKYGYDGQIQRSNLKNTYAEKDDYRDQIKFLKLKKNLNRKLGMTNNNILKTVIDEVQMTEKKIHCYIQYMKELSDFIEDLRRKQMTISAEEIRYLIICNRQRYNAGCKEVFLNLKRKRIILDKIKALNKRYGYSYYEYEESLYPFKLPSNKWSFFDKLSHTLLYKPILSGPYGEITLFNKMERIKLAYLSLQEHLNIENLNKIHLNVYAINDQFQKYGILSYYKEEGKDQVQKGGINGKTLKNSWHEFLPFLSNIKEIYEYMGEGITFIITIQIFMINFFILITFLGIAGWIIQINYFQNRTTNHYLALIVFFVVMVSLTCFVQIWRAEENKFFDSYVSQQAQVLTRQQFKGPYFRSLILDDMNVYKSKQPFLTILKAFLSQIVIVIILALMAVFFWQMRLYIILVYSIQNIATYSRILILSFPHLIFYAVYFISTRNLIRLAVRIIIKKLVQFQNYPTILQHEERLKLYDFMFILGVQIIPPVFILIIQSLQKVRCYAGQCQRQFKIYIICRYILLLCVSINRISVLGIFSVKANVMELHKERPHLQNFQGKYSYFLNYIQKESQKESINYSLEDEALSLFHYCIFSIYFPFCCVINCVYLYIQYLCTRYELLHTKQRSISVSMKLSRITKIFETIVHLCIIINSWGIIFTFEVVEYSFHVQIESILSTDVSENHIMLIKMMVVLILTVIVEAITFQIKIFLRLFISDILLNRKKVIAERVILKKNLQKIQHLKMKIQKPLTSVFRCYTFEKSTEYIKNRLKKYKERLGKYKQTPNSKSKNSSLQEPQENIKKSARSNFNKVNSMQRYEEIHHQTQSIDIADIQFKTFTNFQHTQTSFIHKKYKKK